jgi:alpha-tubulin suppressor-like RCC1 family protein
VTSNGSSVAGALTWGVVNPALVTLTVAGDGRSAVVRGKIVGTTRVVASYEGTAAASTVTITAPPPANQPPVARANGPYTATVGVPFTLSAAGSYDPDGTIASYIWNMGPSSAFGANPSYTYNVAGTFTVTLTVFDDKGATGQSQATVVVAGNQVPTVTINGPFTVDVGVPVTFTATGNDTDGTIVEYLWQLSNELYPVSTSTGSLTRTFATPGTYSVAVAALDDDGASSQSRSTSVTVRPVGTGTFTATSVAAGEWHTCALTSTGQAYCWGLNQDGQLGNDARGTNSWRPVAVLMPSGVTFVRLAAGDDYTCGFTSSGAAYCWGDNSSGQLGTGNTQFHDRPTPLMTGLTLSTVGDTHACGSYNGVASCWGSNQYGQISGTPGQFTTTPVSIAPPAGVELVGMVAGGNFTCLHTQATINGTLQRSMDCRGGGLFDWTVNAGTAVGSLYSGAGYACHTWLNAGGMRCWGSNAAGQFGIGSTSSQSPPVSTNDYFITVFGGGHTCGTYGGVTSCAGGNSDGQLGNGTTSPSAVPTPVPITGGAINVLGAGSRHTCGTRNGTLHCWGDNSYGALGDGTTTDRHVPTPVVSPAP